MPDDIPIPRRVLVELLNSLTDTIEKMEYIGQKRLELSMTKARLQSILDTTPIGDPDKTPRHGISSSTLKAARKPE